MTSVRSATLLVVALAALSRRDLWRSPPPPAPAPPSLTAVAAPGQPRAAALLYGGRLDLNRATVEDLAALPGIGPERAARISRRRQQRGPFRSVEDLREVPGVGETTVNRLRPLVTMSGD